MEKGVVHTLSKCCFNPKSGSIMTVEPFVLKFDYNFLEA